MPRGKPKTRKKTAARQAAALVRATAATRPPTPIVVIHGDPASNLFDLYLTTPDQAYTLSSGFLGKPTTPAHYDRLPFHPDDPTTTLNTTGKTVTPSRIAAINAFYVPYENLVESLKKNVGSQDRPAPVFPIAYDWRFDSSTSALVLDSFITEVLRIVSRLPDYKDFPPDEVDIVAHSFGGLVTARYLRGCQQQKPVRPTRVRKVVTIATPFRGAVDAFHTMIKDLDQREAARTLPSVYGLLPYFENASVDVTKGVDPPPAIDLITDPTIWGGSSVERSLVNYCLRMGSSKAGSVRLQELRSSADRQRTDLMALDVATALGSADNWLPIVGIGNKTNVQVQVVSMQPGAAPDAEFAFVEDNTGDRTGDNTVPFLGAIPPFNLETGAPGSLTPRRRLVCMTQDDVSAKERLDWLGLGQLLGLASLHSFMPRMDAVQQIVFGFLRATPPKFRAKAHPAPGVAPEAVNWPQAWCVTT